MSDPTPPPPPRRSNVSPFIPKRKPGQMAPRPPPRPMRPVAALAAKMAKEEDQEMAGTATPASATPVAGSTTVAPTARKSEQSHEDLQAQLDDLYTKLEERDAKIEELEADAHTRAATAESEATIKKNLEAEVKQYAYDLKDKSELLVMTQNNLVSARTVQLTAHKALEVEHKLALACFHDAQRLADQLKIERDEARAANAELHNTIEGAQKDFQAMSDRVHELNSNATTYQEAKDFVDRVAAEVTPIFLEMGRELNATNVINHIHELQNSARQPRRKAERKVSMADELAGHSDTESEEDVPVFHSGPSQAPPEYHMDDFEGVPPEMSEEELAEAEIQVDAINASLDLATEQANLQTSTNQQNMAEILARHPSVDDSSPLSPPVPAFDYEKEFRDAQERCKEVEAELTIKIARVEELERADRLRRENAIKADRAAAVEKMRQQEREKNDSAVAAAKKDSERAAATERHKAEKIRIAKVEAAEKARIDELNATEKIRLDAKERADAVAKSRAADQAAAEKARLAEQAAADAAEKDRLAEEVKTLTTKVAHLQSIIDADTEKIRLTEMVKARDDKIEQLQDRVAGLLFHQARHEALQEEVQDERKKRDSDLKYENEQHAKSMKAKDAQIAEWQKSINEIQSNSRLVRPVEMNKVYVEVTREKTTFEWLRDSPIWWKAFLFVLVLSFCMGHYAVWSERYAWVTANTYALDHIRALADPDITSSNFITIWIEDLIGFDRSYWG